MRLLSFIGALVLAVSLTAHPTHSFQDTNHRGVAVLDDLRLRPNVEYLDNNQQTPVSSSDETLMPQSYVETATQLVREKFANVTIRLKDDHYVGDNGVAHVHFRQTVHGVDVDNADFNVNVSSSLVFSHEQFRLITVSRLVKTAACSPMETPFIPAKSLTPIP
jgi:extracellular elastinolytic metalloproteinase